MTDIPKTILIVDDEVSQRRLLGGFLSSCGFGCIEAGSAEEALEKIRQQPFGMVLLDVRLPGMSGLDALVEIRKMATYLPVLLITAHADLRQAVSAVKTGADDYLAKPIDLDELRIVVSDTLGPHDEGQCDGIEIGVDPGEGIVCESSAMRALLKTVVPIARSDASVLVLGESGVGKEVIAGLLHRFSPRSANPLVVANCSTLSESLIESDLFGHKKGAFTGAQEQRQGLFRAAHTGTLFLDEIGEIPLALQSKLLRALESGQVVPVGGDSSVLVDVRIVAATNRDLTEEISQGRFREDLYYRLAVVEISVPPLRERADDIVPLARSFAARLTGGPVRFSPQASSCLVSHRWPGNVRELRNAIHRACLLSRGDVILPEHLPPKVVQGCTGPVPSVPASSTLSEVERATILSALTECNGNRTQAARKLGISRRGLIYKLKSIPEEKGSR